MKRFLLVLSKEMARLLEVALLQKVGHGVSLENFEEVLKEMCKGLSVKLTGLSLATNAWVKVRISGEDERIAVRFLEKELGLAPIVAENVNQFSVLRGRIAFYGGSRVKVFVDVGVFSPKPIYAFIPLQRLQGQLVDGKKFALERIVELFGLANGFPLDIRMVKISANEFEAELSDKQLELYRHWIDSRFDRLVVLGVFSERVKEAVK